MTLKVWFFVFGIARFGFFGALLSGHTSGFPTNGWFMFIQRTITKQKRTSDIFCFFHCSLWCSHARRGRQIRRCQHYSFTITGGIVLGGSSRGGGWVPGGSYSGTGCGSVGGMTGLSMFGSGVSAGIGILIIKPPVAHGVSRA